MSALLLSLSTPADHSDSKIIWPWCPYSQRPQVDQGDSLDMYMEKTALVRKIARFYEQPSEIYPFNRNFTGWQHALFYSLTPATLRRLAPFPSRIKTLGDNAKPFAHLFVHGWAHTITPGVSSNEEQPRVSKFQLDKTVAAVAKRDLRFCVMTDKIGVVDYVCILPYAVLTLDAAVLAPLLDVAAQFFETSFHKHLMQGIVELRTRGDQPWNMLCLRSDMRALFHRGMVGLRPEYLAKDREEGTTTWFAALSFQWLARNKVVRTTRVVPGEASIADMLAPSDDDDKVRDTPGGLLQACRRLNEDTIFIPFENKRDAQMMMSALALRWAAGVIWQRAGATGLAPGELEC